MVAIDTSVWIEYFRGRDSAVIAQLNELLDEEQVLLPAPVWIELLSGASSKEQSVLREVLSALPRAAPSKNIWKALETWIVIAKKRGKRFGMADLLIAAICAENHARLWSLDSDFDHMSRLKWIKNF